MRFLQDFANFYIGNKYLNDALLFIQALLLVAKKYCNLSLKNKLINSDIPHSQNKVSQDKLNSKYETYHTVRKFWGWSVSILV